jgi:hypothetical protein
MRESTDVCAVILLWSVHNAADTSPQFPEPIAGYRNEPVGYDELPPDNPATIDLGAVNFDAATKALPSLSIMDLHDGVEISGTLTGIADKNAKVTCIAIDISRQFEQDHQLIASHSDFFELNDGTTDFRLSTHIQDAGTTDGGQFYAVPDCRPETLFWMGGVGPGCV